MFETRYLSKGVSIDNMYIVQMSVDKMYISKMSVDKMYISKVK